MGSEAIEWPGKTWGSTTPQRKGSVHKEGRRAGRGSGGGEGKLQTQRGECIGEGSSSNCLQRPSRRHSVRFLHNARSIETRPGKSGAGPGDRAILELRRGGPGPETRAPQRTASPRGVPPRQFPRPAASPGPFPPFVKGDDRSFRKRHLRWHAHSRHSFSCVPRI